MAAVVQLRTKLPDAQMRKLIGKKCTSLDAGLLLNGDVDVYRPDGEPLIILRKGWMTREMIDEGYEALHHLRTYVTDNRGLYAGKAQARSAIAGYFDRQGGRFPYCRTTGFTANEVERWSTVQPMIKRANELLATVLPDRHAAQAEACKKSHPAWVIPGTVFSTITVNNNVVAANHCGDCILFNPHDWHGMTELELKSDDAERLTTVYYFREKIVNCGSPEEELERAKRSTGALA